MEKKTIISCDHSELEEIILEHYGKEYEIMPMEEVGSSQYAATYTQHVSKGNPDKWQAEAFQKFKDGGSEGHILGTILDDLCNKDLLEAGEYIIDVNW